MIQQTAAGDDLVAFPREFVDRYRAEGAWRDLTFAQEFRAVAERFPNRPAVAGPDGTLTYAELDRKADRIAVGLRNLGVAPGDRVLLQLTNSAATILTWYGLLKAGTVPVATLALHRRHEIRAAVRAGRARHRARVSWSRPARAGRAGEARAAVASAAAHGRRRHAGTGRDRATVARGHRDRPGGSAGDRRRHPAAALVRGHRRAAVVRRNHQRAQADPAAAH